MAYKRKSNVGAVVGGITGAVLLLGLLGGIAYKSEGFKNWDINNWFNNNTEKDEKTDVEVESEGNIGVKMLSSTVNDDGTITNVYQYSFNDENVTRTGISSWLGFTDESVQQNVNDFIRTDVDPYTKTFTITKLADFNHQILFKLISVANPNVYANITIDCQQKWLGFNDTESITHNEIMGDSFSIADVYDNAIKSAIGTNNFSSVYTVKSELSDNLNSWTLTFDGISFKRNDEVVNYDDVIPTDSNLNYITCSNDNTAFSDLSVTKEFIINSLHKDSLSFAEEVNQTFERSDYVILRMCFHSNTSVGDDVKNFRTDINLSIPTNEFEFGIAPTSINTEVNSVIF